MAGAGSTCVAVLLLAVGCGGGKASSLSGIGGNAAGGAPGLSGNTGTAGVASTGSGGSSAPPEAGVLPFLPLAVSADGAVVVGRDFQDHTRAMAWTAATGASFIGNFDVSAVSADGSTIVGRTESSSGATRVARLVGGVRSDIPFPRATDTSSSPVAVSRDGNVLAGNAWSANPYFTSSQAFRWTTSGNVEGLGFLPGDGASEVVAMSPDGATIVGHSYDLAQGKARPFRWTKATGMTELATLAGSSLTVPVAVNDLGTTIGDSFAGGQVSYASITSATSRDVIVWRQAAPAAAGGCTGMSAAIAIAADGTALGACSPKVLLAPPTGLPHLLSLPPPPSGFSASDQSVWPVGLSAGANVVVGRYDLGSIGGTANHLAVWTNGAAQPSFVAQTLTGSPGAVELPNPIATTVSEDGSTIVGAAGGPNGWRLRLR